ncbi:MAG TPA: histidine kinase, partial [Anaerolineae bacterium]|nr:histidine kinase [Anaerolineae bacterium]
GLVAGLRRYLEKFQNHTHISTELQVHTLVEPLPYIIETAIFRVIQEALHNVAQHAAADTVQVVVTEEAGNLQFIIRDNGIGISADLTNHPRRQLGLVSITEIARLLHGSIQINSEKSSGTEVILSIPYPKF